MRPNIPQVQTRCILLKNMFDPAEYVSFYKEVDVILRSSLALQGNGTRLGQGPR
jgi:5-formyltetrahydrofolate cyclo-ligase